MLYVIIIIILAAAIINRIRGGLLGPILPKGRGDDVAGVLFGLLAFLIYQEPWAFLAFGVAFRIGEAHGWGHWVGVAIGEQKPRTAESPIDDVLGHVIETNRWAFYGLTLRGLLWGVCLSIPAAFIGWLESAAFLAAGLTMGALYFATRYIPVSFNKRWEIGEYLMGAAFGVALVV